MQTAGALELFLRNSTLFDSVTFYFKTTKESSTLAYFTQLTLTNRSEHSELEINSKNLDI